LATLNLGILAHVDAGKTSLTERLLHLAGAILVISAVEGVQAQTRVLMRTLHRLRIPTLIFVNKVDRSGARFGGVLDEIAARLGPQIVPMSRVDGIGTRAARVRPDVDMVRLADHDEAVLAAFVDGRPLPRLTVHDRVHPVYFGSAITGAGLDALVEGITGLLPPAAGDPGADPAGTVFKVDRGDGGREGRVPADVRRHPAGSRHGRTRQDHRDRRLHRRPDRAP